MTDLITIITQQYKQEIIKFTVNMTSAEFGLDYGYMKVFVYLQCKFNNITEM